MNSSLKELLLSTFGHLVPAQIMGLTIYGEARVKAAREDCCRFGDFGKSGSSGLGRQDRSGSLPYAVSVFMFFAE